MLGAEAFLKGHGRFAIGFVVAVGCLFLKGKMGGGGERTIALIFCSFYVILFLVLGPSLQGEELGYVSVTCKRVIKSEVPPLLHPVS